MTSPPLTDRAPSDETRTTSAFLKPGMHEDDRIGSRTRMPAGPWARGKYPQFLPKLRPTGDGPKVPFSAVSLCSNLLHGRYLTNLLAAGGWAVTLRLERHSHKV